MRLSRSAQSIIGIPLAFYGYLLQKTWGATDGAAPGFSGFAASAVTTAACVTLALAVAFSAKLLGAERSRKILFWAGMGMQAVVALLDAAIMIGGFDAPAARLLSLALRAGGTIVISALWIEIYATRNPVQASFLCAASTAVSAIGLYIIEQVAGLHLFALRLTLTLSSAALYWLSWREIKLGGTSPDLQEQRFFVPYRAIVFVLAYSFAYGIASFITHAHLTNYAAVIPSAIVIALAVFNARSSSSALLARVAMPLLIGGSLFAAFASTDFDPLSTLLLDTGCASMELLILLLVCAATYSANGSALWLFCLLAASQFLGQFAGFLLASSLDAHAGTSEFVVMEIVAMVVVVAISPLLASDSSLSAFWQRATRADSIPETDSLQLRLDELGSRFGLTEREREVLGLAAQGKTNAVIAEDLFLSEGTVKTHLHHVYRKFGIRNRTELMKMIGK